MLKRKFYDVLANWKASNPRKCLLVKGARQIGKTFIIDHFGKTNYTSYLYLNFLTNPEYREFFDGNLEADDIFKRISARLPSFRVVPGETFIFLDEIQVCPKARAAFKPLAIDGRAHVVGSGSLLGITFLDDGAKLNQERREASIPVGYEQQVVMYSLDFEEFLWAVGYTDDSLSMYREAFDSLTTLPNSTNEHMLRLFREHIVIGGMPDVVATYIKSKNFGAVFEVQRDILASNLDDISRYALTVEKPKVRACYVSIPSQLARENRKFKYSSVEKNGSSRKFGSSIDWLRESALALQCHNLEAVDIPLRAYKKNDMFKLYVADTGILAAMSGFEIVSPIIENTLKGPAKGGIYENAMMGALVRRGYEPFYYQKKPGQGEIDFVVARGPSIVPIEVKAGSSSSESFNRLVESPEIQVGYKFINGNVGRFGKKVTLPHYMVMFV